jgi:chitin disaccharide deacetylase
MFDGFAIGVHLTLTCEYPGYRRRGLTNGVSLHDQEGFLPATTQAALERLDAADARAECRAQLETALSWGVDVTHLDTHMNVVQARSDLYEIYLDLAEEFRLPVRIFPWEGPLMQVPGARERAEARGLLFNEHLVYPWPRRTRDVFFDESRSCRRASARSLPTRCSMVRNCVPTTPRTQTSVRMTPTA